MTVADLVPCIAPHDHVVNVYEDDAQLIHEVVDFLAEGLANGDPVIVVGTSSHRQAVEFALAERFGAEVLDPTQYVSLDAAAMLATFMVDGVPDGNRFAAVIGGAIERMSKPGHVVRAYGEMVALLWETGNAGGAIQLERLWNELDRRHPFSLYCAYPAASLASGGELREINEVCEHHSRIVPPRSYTARPGDQNVLAGEVSQHSDVFLPVTVAVKAARRFVSQVLASWGDDELVEDAAVVVSELATNAVLHAKGAFRVSVERLPTTIRIALEDLNTSGPVVRQQGIGTIGGRGMALVAALSESWGTDVFSHGKVVWAVLARR